MSLSTVFSIVVAVFVLLHIFAVFLLLHVVAVFVLLHIIAVFCSQYGLCHTTVVLSTGGMWTPYWGVRDSNLRW